MASYKACSEERAVQQCPCAPNNAARLPAGHNAAGCSKTIPRTLPMLHLLPACRLPGQSAQMHVAYTRGVHSHSLHACMLVSVNHLSCTHPDNVGRTRAARHPWRRHACKAFGLSLDLLPRASPLRPRPQLLVPLHPYVPFSATFHTEPSCNMLVARFYSARVPPRCGC